MLWILFAPSRQSPNGDRVYPPGFDNSSFEVYSGYLPTTNSSRELHYLFLSSAAKGASDPLVLWLNGGPGCSSLLGAFSEIGPYVIPNSYKRGDPLIPNRHAWNQHVNLLFIESPGGVGFSIDKNDSYTDQLTAEDNYEAVKAFVTSKFPELRGRDFFIAGESYAGKYIPDLARLLLERGGLGLKGILVGNGVFSFKNNEKTKSMMEYLLSHHFIEAEWRDMYSSSCRLDWDSPRCNLFKNWFNQLRSRFNVYNIYEVCEPPQARQLALKLEQAFPGSQPQALPPCHSDQGMTSYLNLQRSLLNIKPAARVWSSCNENINYTADQAGSIQSYLTILGRIRVLIYSGDFDDQVPLIDSLKNMRNLLGLTPATEYLPWFYEGQHAGFVQKWQRNVTLVTLKGAGHMAPQDKRGQAYHMFYNYITERPL